ncbi:TRAP transporter large permease [Rubrobacter taiwanensis]|jgi:tripartite ATP-independent transporter DctM subunit|uniref:TRAP transporter large permease n=1 Tax=Rubrobacter taiwanensis TaxID=185139 RepID=A0A4R1B864_9ACTN|nr:TRAP transporter large permease [Rubrobacter taiwanensis]TCJ13487.1 TRAP transporter large permease [Rubrobacter taiwanensis]
MFLVFIGLLVALFLLGMPVAFGIAITAVVLMLVDLGQVRTLVVPQMMASGVNSFVILAVPLFVLAGKLMNAGGISDRIFRFANVLVGYLPGGLGHVNVVSSVLFSGMSGAAVSDAAGLGQVQIRAMRNHGYDKGFASAITASSSTIGPMIPPSLPAVVYAVAAGVSVGALFIAGIIPGLIMAALLLLMVAILAHRRDYPREDFPSAGAAWRAFRGAVLPLLTPVIIIGGIVEGTFTATEAAAVAVLYSAFLGAVVYRELKWRDFVQVLRETAQLSAAIGLIVAAATLYGNVIIRAQIPQAILEAFTAFANSPLVVLLILNLFLLLVGCFLETIAAITILVPLLLPLLQAFEVDPLHFGVIMILNLMIGLLTPPLGLVLFVVSRIGEISILELVRALGPFYLMLVLALIIVTLFPGVVLWLPGLLME